MKCLNFNLVLMFLIKLYSTSVGDKSTAGFFSSLPAYIITGLLIKTSERLMAETPLASYAKSASTKLVKCDRF